MHMYQFHLELNKEEMYSIAFFLKEKKRLYIFVYPIRSHKIKKKIDPKWKKMKQELNKIKIFVCETNSAMLIFW